MNVPDRREARADERPHHAAAELLEVVAQGHREVVDGARLVEGHGEGSGV